MYAMLHLTGVKAVNPKYEVLGEPSVTLDDIKRFRQLDSKCPGHPEYLEWLHISSAVSGMRCVATPGGGEHAYRDPLLWYSRGIFRRGVVA